MGNALARQTGEAGGKEPVAAVLPVGLLTHTLAAVSVQTKERNGPKILSQGPWSGLQS